MRKPFLIFIIIFLAACNTASPPVTETSETIVIKPSPTPTVVPSATATLIPPTSSPEPTSNPPLFHEDFVEAFDPQWHWVREDPLNWSLEAVPGSLQINVGNGYVMGHNNANLLLRPAPEGNFL